MLVVVGTYTSVHEAHMARSVLAAAGMDAHIADEHLVSMDWTYSNAIGGVKVLVPEDRSDEARELLASGAEAIEEPFTDNNTDKVDLDTCRRCGGCVFTSRPAAGWFAMLSWLTFGFPLGSPKRHRYCRECGEPAGGNSAPA